MGWFGDFELDRENDMFWQRHKLSNGQYCMIGFERIVTGCGDVEEYNVIFAVADKKKQLRGYFNASGENNITLKSTGKCGIEALLWAKEKILEFEEELRGYMGQKVTMSIIVTGENQRRFHMYERALSKIGYKKVPGRGNGDYPWYMKKTVVKNGKLI